MTVLILAKKNGFKVGNYGNKNLFHFLTKHFTNLEPLNPLIHEFLKFRSVKGYILRLINDEVFGRGRIILWSSLTDEIEVPVFIPEVLPSPLHVVRDVEEDGVTVVVLPEVVHGVIEISLLVRVGGTELLSHVRDVVLKMIFSHKNT